MGKKWIYRHKKEGFAHVAQRLNVALEGRLDDMRKALSEYYSATESDPQLVDIWAELEATYHDRAGPSITLTPMVRVDLGIASFSPEPLLGWPYPARS